MVDVDFVSLLLVEAPPAFRYLLVLVYLLGSNNWPLSFDSSRFVGDVRVWSPVNMLARLAVCGFIRGRLGTLTCGAGGRRPVKREEATGFAFIPNIYLQAHIRVRWVGD